jgi:hypothetical protein
MSVPRGARPPQDARAPYPLRTHQRRALDALEPVLAARRGRAWVVLPPGAGKTLVGLEAARRHGRPTLVLGPNTAIQQQWLAGWDSFLPADPDPGARSGASRELATWFTALTYQALASFDPDAEVDEDGEEQPLLAALHPNGRRLVERLAELGEVTVVLDECHHLLEVWGRLLREVLELLPDAFVLGLTATPPATLTPAQHELVDDLFGPPLLEATVPAAVREGDLAPFAECAWLTTPTPVEAGWLAEQETRFAELTTALTDPAFGSTPFLTWLDRRFTDSASPGAGPPVTWDRLHRDRPALADAALRLVHAGLLALPPGARLAEPHRRPPTADDWAALLDDWVTGCLTRSGEPGDEATVEAIRGALPAVGLQLTRRGIRRGRSPVDRVLARSEAKTAALPEIVAAEHATLGDRLRMLVLCDHELATATLPASLDGVLGEEAGSARLALEHLVRATPELAPLPPWPGSSRWRGTRSSGAGTRAAGWDT